MNRGQGARARTLLLYTGFVAWFTKDATLSNKDNMTITEFFFKLTDKSYLNFVESFDERNRDKDNNSFTAMSNFNL
jgi:hypothetical protein